MTNSCDPKCDSSSKQPLQDISNRRVSTAKELVAVIRKDKFDEFLRLLESKPSADLNTFVNGNTALHYCLMFGTSCRTASPESVHSVCTCIPCPDARPTQDETSRGARSWLRTARTPTSRTKTAGTRSTWQPTVADLKC